MFRTLGEAIALPIWVVTRILLFTLAAIMGVFVLWTEEEASIVIGGGVLVAIGMIVGTVRKAIKVKQDRQSLEHATVPGLSLVDAKTKVLYNRLQALLNWAIIIALLLIAISITILLNYFIMPLGDWAWLVGSVLSFVIIGLAVPVANRYICARCEKCAMFNALVNVDTVHLGSSQRSVNDTQNVRVYDGATPGRPIANLEVPVTKQVTDHHFEHHYICRHCGNHTEVLTTSSRD
ncbi:hypothetical protein ACERK3_19390 [Phycisphaerales bacterium AB-hyl4]|uniref:Uncharacterized protein n=1 Tax=Natronomicrosphaera hydrolytica TaxID=3242702 RepID=A0ABV4UA04_9BACT